MRQEFKRAFQVSIPVMLGYMVLGMAYGLVLVSFDYPWYLATFSSLVLYAGALQFVLIGFFNAKMGLIDVAIATFFVNIRQSFYGLSLLKRFKNTQPYKHYLIFGLTDETYALLTTIKDSEQLSKKHYYFFLTALNQTYWVTGTTVGALMGESIQFNTDGLAFSLTALFVVLSIEQYKNLRKKTPFIIGAVTSVLAMILVPSDKMLITAILLALGALLLLKSQIENE